ncbi:dienelactone hydrolase family protein [Fodinicola acaciae]|uniref:dienelactone hydrolase family protein n=1 Tax=Fodinicola acaciae TaxID=2681555 RepID=UPI0013D4FF62|nr:dienelactone hydrolase family protein [Fodinicola acaciae]
MSSGYLAIPESGSGPAVLVVGDGLTGHLMSVADRLAAEGFLALVPKTGPADAARRLLELPESTGRLGILGFGDRTLPAAAELRPAAVVSFYPRPADLVWSRFRGVSVVLHQVDGDTSIQRQIADAGGSCRAYAYDAVAGFFNDDCPRAYHSDAARTAWARSLELLRGLAVARAA